MRAVALLSFWKFRNWLRTLLTDPRKLVPALLFLFFMSCSFGSMMLGALAPSHHRATIGSFHPDPELFKSILFLTMVMISIGAVDSGLGDALLAFSLPDIDYLFPSPISRKVVLAFRIPKLLFGSLGTMAFFLVMYSMLLNLFDVQLPHQGTERPPWFIGPGCMVFCFGSYLNLAMFVAIWAKNRTLWHRVFLGLFLGGVVVLVGIGWIFGIQRLLPIAASPILHTLFLPCAWAAQGLSEQALRTSDASPLYYLFLTYAVSLIPMFSVNANYYEQSIVSTERIAAVRKAAKSGFAAQQSSRAERFKYKARREFLVRPFGRGAMAVVWAHVSAAAKRPYANLLFPIGAGIACGLMAFLANTGLRDSGIGVIAFFAFYSSMGFMGSARTASEAAVRRRDLVAPLPIPAWQGVLANLAVPWGVMLLFYATAGISYAALGSDHWPMIVFGLCVLFPLRLGSRMILQYVMVLAYPDFSDKLQQLLAQFVYYLVAAPFIVAEVLFALPAVFLHSIWLGLGLLSLLEAGFWVLFVWAAGIASAKAVATGEPVSLLRVFAKT